MKKIIGFFLLCIASTAFAEDITFQWDASPGGADGYTLWQGTQAGGPYVAVQSVAGTSLTTTYVNADVRKGDFFVVTAFLGTATAKTKESGYSNEVRVSLQLAPPGALRRVVP